MNASKCPKCGNPTDLSAESCPSCGIIFSRYYMSRMAGKKTDKDGPRPVRLLIDVMLGVFGISATLTGFVVLFASFLHSNGANGVAGGTSCLILGSISIVLGILSLLGSFHGITGGMK